MDSDTSLSSIINGEFNQSIVTKDDQSKRYNLRKRHMFFCHLDKNDYDNPWGDDRKMNTRSGTNKRRKMRDQEEVVKMKDEIAKGIENSHRFTGFMTFISEVQSPESLLFDGPCFDQKFNMAQKAILSNIIKVVDAYVELKGWSLTPNSLDEYPLESLAQMISSLRKKILL